MPDHGILLRVFVPTIQWGLAPVAFDPHPAARPFCPMARDPRGVGVGTLLVMAGTPGPFAPVPMPTPRNPDYELGALRRERRRHFGAQRRRRPRRDDGDFGHRAGLTRRRCHDAGTEPGDGDDGASGKQQAASEKMRTCLGPHEKC
jgi:hypothetical protein